MEIIKQKKFTGERALFNAHDIEIRDSVFEDGESPIKESSNVKLSGAIFRWKYPLWYCRGVEVIDSTFIVTARSGIWYTEGVSLEGCTVDAPKTFRRCKGVTIKNSTLSSAEETLWNCKDIIIENTSASGDYFGMGVENAKLSGFSISGNYLFDGGKNIEIENSRLISKDAFWNAENVTVRDSVIVGEYLGWNSKNVRFINCTIESNQGMCYIDNLVLENCKLINTDLAFEYSSVDATLVGSVDSVKNPKSGVIRADSIGEIILDERVIDPEKIIIETK